MQKTFQSSKGYSHNFKQDSEVSLEGKIRTNTKDDGIQRERMSQLGHRQ